MEASPDASMIVMEDPSDIVSDNRMQAALAARRHRVKLMGDLLKFINSMSGSALREKLAGHLDRLQKVNREHMKLDSNFDLLMGTRVLLKRLGNFFAMQPVTLPRWARGRNRNVCFFFSAPKPAIKNIRRKKRVPKCPRCRAAMPRNIRCLLVGRCQMRADPGNAGCLLLSGVGCAGRAEERSEMGGWLELLALVKHPPSSLTTTRGGECTLEARV
jgi:hypothetical protein